MHSAVTNNLLSNYTDCPRSLVQFLLYTITHDIKMDKTYLTSSSIIVAVCSVQL